MRGTESHKHITADLFSKPSYRHHHHQHHHKLARAPLNRWPAAPYVQHTVQKIKYIKWNWIKEKMNVSVESVQNSEQVSFLKMTAKRRVRVNVPDTSWKWIPAKELSAKRVRPSHKSVYRRSSMSCWMLGFRARPSTFRRQSRILWSRATVPCRRRHSSKS